MTSFLLNLVPFPYNLLTNMISSSDNSSDKDNSSGFLSYLIPSPSELLKYELTVSNLFIRPNILMWNRPEVFAFKSGNLVFIVESGSGGIYGHAHKLTETKSPTIKIDGALVYFTLDTEYLHSHPNDTSVYYISKNTSNKYAIFDSTTKTEVSRCSFDALHWHSLTLRETIVVDVNEPIKQSTM
jgi:hypothetical protein